MKIIIKRTHKYSETEKLLIFTLVESVLMGEKTSTAFPVSLDISIILPNSEI